MPFSDDEEQQGEAPAKIIAKEAGQKIAK